MMTFDIKTVSNANVSIHHDTVCLSAVAEQECVSHLCVGPPVIARLATNANGLIWVELCDAVPLLAMFSILK